MASRGLLSSASIQDTPKNIFQCSPSAGVSSRWYRALGERTKGSSNRFVRGLLPPNHAGNFRSQASHVSIFAP
jgi:hypothetical protein